MSFVLRVIGFVNGKKSWIEEQFIASCDFDQPSTVSGVPVLCTPITSKQVKNAKKFSSQTEAWLYWNTISEKTPLRPWDNRPNKPLTAFNVWIEEVKDDGT